MFPSMAWRVFQLAIFLAVTCGIATLAQSHNQDFGLAPAALGLGAAVISTKIAGILLEKATGRPPRNGGGSGGAGQIGSRTGIGTLPGQQPCQRGIRSKV
jgi:hypothetical protein